MPQIYALIDCNNFYASCERVFDPSLKHRPVAVLSNNDGCIIARSNELKDAGIKMAGPYFQIKEELARLNTKVFSANFALYGDMSDRVMQTLGHFTGEMEVYSIDEAFLVIPDFGLESVMEYGELIRKTVYQWTGIPVSIGLGKTKTLAKAANNLAKSKTRSKQTNTKYFKEGIFNLFHHDNPAVVLQELPAGDVWGVGRKYAKMLENNGITNAYQLSKCSSTWVGDKMTVVGQRLVQELNGINCYILEKNPVAKKNIACTRSFPVGIKDKTWIQQSVSTYCARIGEKLRKQNSVAGLITAFVITNRSDPNGSYYGSKTLVIPTATSHTSDLTRTALKALDQIFKEGLEYKKAGVIVSNIVPQGSVQTNIFDAQDNIKQTQLMQAIDKINSKYGRDKIKTLASGLHKGFRMKQEWMSRPYTTDYRGLLEVR